MEFPHTYTCYTKPYMYCAFCFLFFCHVFYQTYNVKMDTRMDIYDKPLSHIHDFGHGRATVHPDLSNRGASA